MPVSMIFNGFLAALRLIGGVQAVFFADGLFFCRERLGIREAFQKIISGH
ncbi:MAG: hypothetical protein ACFCA4_12110 [Cyanophyceae cyanobacterium]